MTITLWNLFEALLLCLNAICVLNEERFLAKIGWSAKSPNVGFSENPSAKSQILNLIYSIRTVARKTKYDCLLAHYSLKLVFVNMECEQFLILKMHLLRYLVQSNLMKQLECSIKEYFNNLLEEIIPFSHFYFNVHINLVELNDVSGSAVDLLFKEPDVVQSAINDIIFLALYSRNDQHRKIDKPICPIVIIFSPVKDDTEYLTTGLVFIKGIIVEHSMTSKAIGTSGWKCNKSRCCALDLIICEKTGITPICNNCTSPLKRTSPYDEYYDNVLTVKMIIYRTPSIYYKKYIFGRIEYNRADNDIIQIGEEVVSLGLWRNSFFEIWGIQELREISILPNNNIEKLRIQSLKNCPWTFSQKLASTIGPDYLQSRSYVTLKMSLLLSLVSTNDFAPISILAVAQNLNVVQLIMDDAASLASKCVKPSDRSSFGAEMTTEGMSAGTLLLASEGVCFLGPWLQGKEMEPVVEAIASGRITLKGGRGRYMPLKCAIWSYIDKTSNIKKLEQFKTLRIIFGVPWTEEIDNNLEEDIVDKFLSSKYYSRNKQIENREMRDYIDTIKTKPVELSQDALDLLTKYFICSRKCRDGSPTMQSLEQLSSLARSHARLNQREVAMPEDAVIAIQLCEETLGQCIGLPMPPENTKDFWTWLNTHILPLHSPSVI